MFQPIVKLIEKGTLLTGRPAEEVRKAQLAAMHEATQFGVRRVKERTPQGVSGAQGGLMGSIQPDVISSGSKVIGIIGTANPYGLVVEKGRRPKQKMPPPGVLLQWIELKLGVSREEAEQIELPIRRKIYQRGTKGAFMFEKTLEEDWADFQAIFERHGVRIARELGK
jgi:hypothetical protein